MLPNVLIGLNASNKKVLSNLELQVSDQSKRMNKLQHRIKFKQERINTLLQKEAQLDKANLPVIAISSAARKRRFQNPTNEKLSVKAKQRHCAEILSVCEAIHDGCKENINPVVTGMLSTLNSK